MAFAAAFSGLVAQKLLDVGKVSSGEPTVRLATPPELRLRCVS